MKINISKNSRHVKLKSQLDEDVKKTSAEWEEDFLDSFEDECAE